MRLATSSAVDAASLLSAEVSPLGGSVHRHGENPMKVLISTFAMAIALAVTGPAFAGPGSTITNKEDCEKAGKVWDEAGKKCVEKQ